MSTSCVSYRKFEGQAPRAFFAAAMGQAPAPAAATASP